MRWRRSETSAFLRTLLRPRSARVKSLIRDITAFPSGSERHRCAPSSGSPSLLFYGAVHSAGTLGTQPPDSSTVWPGPSAALRTPSATGSRSARSPRSASTPVPLSVQGQPYLCLTQLDDDLFCRKPLPCHPCLLPKHSTWIRLRGQGSLSSNTSTRLQIAEPVLQRNSIHATVPSTVFLDFRTSGSCDLFFIDDVGRLKHLEHGSRAIYTVALCRSDERDNARRL